MLLRRDTKMRVNRTHPGGMYGGSFMLVRKADIYIDLNAVESGDGSAEAPINSFDVLFADDEVECTCRALCCDKIVVKVKGDLPADDAATVIINGQGRDYAGNLVITPWGDACTLQAKATYQAKAGEKLEVYRDLFRSLHGVWFRDIELVNTVTVEKDATVKDGDKLEVVGDINIFNGCRDLDFRRCNLLVGGRFDVGTAPGVILPYNPLPGEEPEYEPGIHGIGGESGYTRRNYVLPARGGSGGSNWQGGGTSGTSGTSGTGAWEIIAAARVICVGSCLRMSPGAVIADSTLNTDLDIRSSTGARAQAFGILRSGGSRIANSATIVIAHAYDNAGGDIDAETGEIAAFSLVADAVAVPVAMSGPADIDRASLSSDARAQATPANTPTNGGIGGIAKAEAYSGLGSPNSMIASTTGAAAAYATHPNRWIYTVDGLRDCAGSDVTASTFPARVVQSSHPGGVA